MLTALQGVAETAAAVWNRLGCSRVDSLNAAKWLGEVATLVASQPRPTHAWFADGPRIALEELLTEAEQHQAIIAEVGARLEERFELEFFEVATSEFADRLESYYGSWLRYVKPGYYRDMGRLRRTLKGDTGLDYSAAVDAVRLARRLAASNVWMSDHRNDLAASFPYHYSGRDTDWTAVRTDLRVIRDLVALLGTSGVPQRIVDLLVDRPALLEFLPRARALRTALEEAEGALSDLRAIVSSEGLPFGVGPEDAPRTTLAQWLSWWRDGLRPLWDAVATIAPLRLGSADSVAQMLTDVREAVAVVAIGHELASASEQMWTLFGPYFNGLDTRWDDIQAALAWTSELRNRFPGSLPAPFIDAVGRGTRPSAQQCATLDSAVADVHALIEQVRLIFDTSAFLVGAVDPQHAPLNEVAAWAGALVSALPRMEQWIDYRQAMAEAGAAGLDHFVAGLIRERPPSGQWEDALLRQLFILWLTWRYEQASILARFRHEQHQDLIDRFRSLDQWQWRAASRRIAQRIAAKRPVVGPHLRPTSEPKILLREAAKKRRFRPLRKLFADLPVLLPTLKPCMLMSPLAVAQYLGDSAMEFDLVIFDEASQILPADAIGAIGRGRQIVVVGDQHQLPPTRFFATSLQENEDDEEVEEAPESILDACRAVGVADTHLRWHYRSRHEHLIAFWNHWIYDRRLITFPSPDERDRAVEFVHVERGRYERSGQRVNRVEAAALVNLVIGHVERSPGQSVGVITFSEAQMIAVQAELDRRKRTRPELETLLSEDGPDGFFIKNLENVQGDERDGIFFSVGYGPDEMGRLSLNFGPLNRSGGERRLNVAVTRARDRVKILASFRPDDLDLNRTRSKGVQLLRKYLEFAERGPIALLSEVTSEGGEPDSPFEEAVIDALMANGLHVVSQVGVGGFRIDIGIQDPDSSRYILGVECDGATYHSSRTARDRDRLRQQVLEQLGWRIHRIWSTDWIKDPKGETRRVLEAVEAARKPPNPGQGVGDVNPVVPRPEDRADHHRPDASPNGASEITEGRQVRRGEDSSGRARTGAEPGSPGNHQSSQARHAVARTYEYAQLKVRGTRQNFDYESREQLARVVHECVAIEGPVHEGRVIEAVAAIYGISGPRKQVQERILDAVDHARRHNGVVRRGDFLWLAGVTTPTVRGADSNGVTRPIDRVALEETERAAVEVLRGQFALPRENLGVAVARELGYGRTGTRVGPRIGAALDGLVASGEIVTVGGQMRLAQ